MWSNSLYLEKGILHRVVSTKYYPYKLDFRILQPIDQNITFNQKLHGGKHFFKFETPNTKLIIRNIWTVANQKLNVLYRISLNIDPDKRKLLINLRDKSPLSYCPPHVDVLCMRKTHYMKEFQSSSRAFKFLWSSNF